MLRRLVFVGIAVPALLIAALARRPSAPRAAADRPAPARACAPASTAPAPQAARSATASVAIARQMLQRIRDGAPSRVIKAYYDAIRRLGPDAIPALVAALADAGLRPTALRALAGVRALARNVSALVERGRTPDEIAAQLDCPRDAVERLIAAGPWAPGLTDLMVDAAAEILRSPASIDDRLGAAGTLYALGDESSAATARLVECAAAASEPPLRDRALMLAGGRLAPGGAGPLVELALQPDRDLAFRLRTALACLPAARAEERDRLRAGLAGPALALLADPSAPPEQRADAVEAVGRLEGAAAIAPLLGAGVDDPLRCAAIKTMMDLRERVDLEAIARETAPSTARLMAQRALRR